MSEFPVETPFRYEKCLVRALIETLGSRTSPWGQVTLTTEFDYQRGRTDVVAVDARGAVVAFEAKLKKWREALYQAYRNQCFANSSYVVVPEQTAENARAFGHEFERRNVGLCYLKDTSVVIVYAPRPCAPLQPDLAAAAQQAAVGGCRDARSET